MVHVYMHALHTYRAMQRALTYLVSLCLTPFYLVFSHLASSHLVYGVFLICLYMSCGEQQAMQSVRLVFPALTTVYDTAAHFTDSFTWIIVVRDEGFQTHSLLYVRYPNQVASRQFSTVVQLRPYAVAPVLACVVPQYHDTDTSWPMESLRMSCPFALGAIHPLDLPAGQLATLFYEDELVLSMQGAVASHALLWLYEHGADIDTINPRKLHDTIQKKDIYEPLDLDRILMAFTQDGLSYWDIIPRVRYTVDSIATQYSWVPLHAGLPCIINTATTDACDQASITGDSAGMLALPLGLWYYECIDCPVCDKDMPCASAHATVLLQKNVQDGRVMALYKGF